MTHEEDASKVARFRAALGRFLERVAEDRYVLAVVMVRSLSAETIWARERLGLWIIEADGVSRRLPSDGEDPRIFRILVEDGINIHAEVIPRTRFKQMVEGMSRTAFSCNFFAHREIVHSKDPSIEGWFEKANQVAIKDRERELLVFSTWTIDELRHARKRLELKGDLELAAQGILSAAHSVAHTEIIRRGEICEQDVIYRAMEGDPELFRPIYLDVLAKRKNRRVLAAALDAIEGYLEAHHREHMKPLLAFLKKQNRVVPLSEMSDHFAFTQMHPGHLEAACEWLERKGLLQKVSAPFKLTKRSLGRVEEPAYILEA
ncbi:hypothetical protein [Aquisphaera insulae]|uniref:hypothetical protein n=1 Tax=Aquisphaera insulae TaxID=2712864 RepID=UPI0013EDE70F|nr:hypothetical protein [Aquisphaera insulae]